jgi:hypothetical protein
MISIKFAAAAGIAAIAFATSASASTTAYIRCDQFNVTCQRVWCDDETGSCRWTNGYSDRYGAFMRAEYPGYYYSDRRWICIRGNGCRVSPEPPIDPARLSP